MLTHGLVSRRSTRLGSATVTVLGRRESLFDFQQWLYPREESVFGTNPRLVGHKCIDDRCDTHEIQVRTLGLQPWSSVCSLCYRCDTFPSGDSGQAAGNRTRERVGDTKHHLVEDPGTDIRHLTVVSAALVVLALTVQTTGFGTEFTLLATGLAADVLLLGTRCAVTSKSSNAPSVSAPPTSTETVASPV